MRNQLIQSNNPVLNRHRDSRVHWCFWDPRALEHSMRGQRPVFLVVIASHCRDCDLLMSGFFEDQGLAEAINERYTAILVDATESPALAKLALVWYRLSHSDAPVNLPVMAAFSEKFAPWQLYRFPADTADAASFAASLREHAGIISSRPDLVDVGSVLYQHPLSLDQAPGAPVALTTDGLIDASERMLAELADPDPAAGGLPRYPALEALLRMTYALYHTPELSARCLGHVAEAASAMMSGGLRDHVGAGFFMRCHDSEWRQPVYVKRLDDNAQMLSLILHLYAITRDADFYDQAKSNLDFVLSEMTAGDEAYLYALHEDARAEPGHRYLYSPAELRGLIPREYYSLFAQMYGLEKLPDSGEGGERGPPPRALPEDDEKPLLLFEHCRLDRLARCHGLSLQKCRGVLDSCLEALRVHSQARRGAVEAESKILTRANALMASALVEAGWLMSDPIYSHYAGKLLDCLVERLWQGEIVYIGSIHTERVAGYEEPSALKRHLLAPGNLDDYVFLLRALLDFLANDLRRDYLDRAVRLGRLILDSFHDERRGEFCYQDRRYYRDVAPLRDIADSDSPGSVPTALICFRRLAWLTGDERFLEVSSRCSGDYIALSLGDPVNYATMISNLTHELNPLIELWFLYDETNSSLANADRIPVFAGRTRYNRINYANLGEVADGYGYKLFNDMRGLPRRDLQIVATRKDEILEVVDEMVDIYDLEQTIKRINRVRL